MSTADEFGHLDLYEVNDATFAQFAQAVADEIADPEPHGQAVARIAGGVLTLSEVALGIAGAEELGLVKVEFVGNERWVSA